MFAPVLIGLIILKFGSCTWILEVHLQSYGNQFNARYDTVKQKYCCCDCYGYSQYCRRQLNNLNCHCQCVPYFFIFYLQDENSTQYDISFLYSTTDAFVSPPKGENIHEILSLHRDTPSPNKVPFHIQVYDYVTNHGVLIDNFTVILPFVTNISYSSPVKYSGTFGVATITFAYRFYCAENYYGNKCDIYCQPTDSYLGHYYCDFDGQKLCIDGYSNPDSNCTDIQQNSTANICPTRSITKVTVSTLTSTDTTTSTNTVTATLTSISTQVVNSTSTDITISTQVVTSTNVTTSTQTFNLTSTNIEIVTSTSTQVINSTSIDVTTMTSTDVTTMTSTDVTTSTDVVSTTSTDVTTITNFVKSTTIVTSTDVITSTAIINSTRIVKVTATTKDDMKVTQTNFYMAASVAPAKANSCDTWHATTGLMVLFALLLCFVVGGIIAIYFIKRHKNKTFLMSPNSSNVSTLENPVYTDLPDTNTIRGDARTLDNNLYSTTNFTATEQYHYNNHDYNSVAETRNSVISDAPQDLNSLQNRNETEDQYMKLSHH